jgi:predicted enzyme related to lactoylglutathione lyase
MKIEHIYLTINAKAHAEQVAWWSKALGRSFARCPVPNCREWDLTSGVIFQVIHDPKHAASASTPVSLHVADVDRERERLAEAGISLSNPVPVPGFKALRWAHVKDPEGNTLNILSGR